MLSLAMLLTVPAMPQTVPADDACAAVRPMIPPELAGWSQPVALVAGDGATLRLGEAADVTLVAQDTAELAVTPEKPSQPGRFAGTLHLRIETAGTVEVALGGKAWVDLVRDRTARVSAGHGHGPQCSGIAKIVRFAVTPGEYVLKITASVDPRIRVLVTAPE